MMYRLSNFLEAITAFVQGINEVVGIHGWGLKFYRIAFILTIWGIPRRLSIFLRPLFWSPNPDLLHNLVGGARYRKKYNISVILVQVLLSLHSGDTKPRNFIYALTKQQRLIHTLINPSKTGLPQAEIQTRIFLF